MLVAPLHRNGPAGPHPRFNAVHEIDGEFISHRHGREERFLRMSEGQYRKRAFNHERTGKAKEFKKPPVTMPYKCTKAGLNWNSVSNPNPLGIPMAQNHQSSNYSQFDDLTHEDLMPNVNRSQVPCRTPKSSTPPTAPVRPWNGIWPRPTRFWVLVCR